MENLIRQFQNQLITQVPELKYIAEDWGQMDFYQDYPPVEFPCALIDLQNGQFSSTGLHGQQGVITVVVKLFILNMHNISSQAPEDMQNEVKQGWVIYEKLNMAIHGQNFLDENFTAPIRVAMQRAKRRDGIYQRDITYTIAFTDNSCVPTPVLATQPSITIQT